MKNYLLLFIFSMLAFSIKAQSGFDDLWKKYDSIQKVTNAKVEQKLSDDYKSIPSIDARKIDSSSIKEINKLVETIKTDNAKIKDKTTSIKETPTTEIKEVVKKEIVEESKVIENQKSIELIDKKVEQSVQQPINRSQSNDIVIEKPIIINEVKKVVVEKSAVEKPIVKEEIVLSKITNFDTTKNFRNFSFETTPIVNGNATYTKPDPIKVVRPNEIDEKIPVNKTIISKENTEEDILAKSNYSEFSKEAETIRRNNDKKLDSVLKTMQLNIPVQFNPNEYVDIYVNGGSILKDNTSKLYDRISILNIGRIHREYKTKNVGEQRVEKNISREQLVKLAQYIIDLGFFDFKASYDCDENDVACNERLTTNPIVLPLQITITIGERKSKVYVAVYGSKTEKNWVNYPSNLDKIMAAIYSVVEK